MKDDIRIDFFGIKLRVMRTAVRSMPNFASDPYLYEDTISAY